MHTMPSFLGKNIKLRECDTSQADNPRKIWQLKIVFFRFDDDNTMSYNYILSVTYTWTSRLNAYNPIHCKEDKDKEGNDLCAHNVC